MAVDRGNKFKRTSVSADEFNTKSAEGAPSPALNRQQLIVQVKGILKKNTSGHSYNTYDGDEKLNPTPNQKELMTAVEQKDVVLVDGPFGTGKTLWIAYMALFGVAEKKYQRIAITAPTVEAGDKLGYLPGEADNKMLPYINQILESMDDWIGKDLRVKLQEAGVIDIEPQAYLRGRTMKRTFFILDESQNATGPQLMTAFSRLGIDSTFVFIGDNHQNDRTRGDSAYVQFINRFASPKYEEYIGYAVLNKEDVRRHPLLKLVVDNGDERPLEQFETHYSGANAEVIPIHKKNAVTKDASLEQVLSPN